MVAVVGGFLFQFVAIPDFADALPHALLKITEEEETS